MVHSEWTLRIQMNVLKTASFILSLATGLWIAFSQHDLITFGICVSLCAVSLFGLQSSRKTLFLAPYLAFAAFFLITIFASPDRGLMVQMAQSLQFLLLIYAAEIGSSTICFNQILQRTRGKFKSAISIPPMEEAVRRYMTRLTEIVASSFIISCLLLFLGNLVSYEIEPLFLVAAAIIFLLLSLVFLGTNLHPTSRQKKEMTWLLEG